jgi:cell division protein FtsN
MVAAAVIAAAAIWIGLHFVRRTETSATPPPARPAQTAAPVPGPAAATPATKPESPAAAVPQPPASSAGVSAPKPTAGAPAPAAAGTRFDVVVASFRTEARAAAIGASVAALNLPVRQRVADGWQQIVVGPFNSRAEAESAIGRLDRAGLTGAQIVASEQ